LLHCHVISMGFAPPNPLLLMLIFSMGFAHQNHDPKCSWSYNGFWSTEFHRPFHVSWGLPSPSLLPPCYFSGYLTESTLTIYYFSGLCSSIPL
jgi:hypothetical protein